MNRTIDGCQIRAAELEKSTIDHENRTVEVAISSEMPVMRWFGNEILSHDTEAVNLARLSDGGAVLLDHDPTSLIGVVEDVSLGEDRRLRGKLRFGHSQRAEEAWRDVKDGIRTKISVGYSIDKYDTHRAEKKGDPDTVIATRWTPMEVSFVSIPADTTVGVGRSEEPHPMGIPPTTFEEVRMDIITNSPTADDQRAESQVSLWEAVQLRSQAEKLGFVNTVDEMIQAGKAMPDIRSELLRLASTKPLPAGPPVVEMSRKEKREYSYARAILAELNQKEGISGQRGFESEVSDSIEKSLPADYQRQGGLFIPLQIRTAGSQMDSITSTAGTETKFTAYGGELIELLRNYCTVIKRGAKVLTGLQGPVTFPKLAADATVYWVAENPGSDMTATAPTFGTVTLTAKTLACAVPFSRQLLAQSVISIEDEVRRNIAAGHALAIDKAALHGTGASNQPTGIYKTTSVNTKAMGGAPTFAKLQDMITEVAKDNALMGSLGWLTTPGMAGKLAQTLAESSAGSDHIWTGDYENGRVNGYSAIATNQVSAVMTTLEVTGGSEHGIIFGNWADLMIGMWGPALELIVDPYVYKKQQLIEVASFAMCDIKLRHPESFCVSTGATI